MSPFKALLIRAYPYMQFRQPSADAALHLPQQVLIESFESAGQDGRD